jgi:hypothetical protein
MRGVDPMGVCACRQQPADRRQAQNVFQPAELHHARLQGGAGARPRASGRGAGSGPAGGLQQLQPASRLPTRAGPQLQLQAPTVAATVRTAAAAAVRRVAARPSWPACMGKQQLPSSCQLVAKHPARDGLVQQQQLLLLQRRPPTTSRGRRGRRSASSRRVLLQPQPLLQHQQLQRSAGQQLL